MTEARRVYTTTTPKPDFRQQRRAALIKQRSDVETQLDRLRADVRVTLAAVDAGERTAASAIHRITVKADTERRLVDDVARLTQKIENR